MGDVTSIVAEVVGTAMSVTERTPVLCEIVRKTEHLQVRAVAVLHADGQYVASHGSWTAFCRAEFGWDDSYASRMRKAAEMVLQGTTITSESQARVLAKVEPERRNEVLEKARERFAAEPSASQVAAVAETSDDDEDQPGTGMADDQRAIDAVIASLRQVLRDVKALPRTGAGRWVNAAHVVADLKNAADALKHARPHGPCDEWGGHDANCLCGGTGWLPKHVLERPRKEA